MTSPVVQLRPRKQPSQERSAFTVDAILEATVHILEHAKDGQFTTKQVAERSGVSIGSLYQYFPNKQALVAELVRRKLTLLVNAATQACVDAPPDYDAALHYVISRIIAEKRENLRLSIALMPVMAEIEVQPIVRDYTGRVFAVVRVCIEDRIARPLSTAETGRLHIAMDAIEGALSVMIKTDPTQLRQDGLSDTLYRMFRATLDIAQD